jgi:hypothetical protein
MIHKTLGEQESSEQAEMFEHRAESAVDPISRQHYREMAAHYRKLLVEHIDARSRETAE